MGRLLIQGIAFGLPSSPQDNKHFGPTRFCDPKSPRPRSIGSKSSRYLWNRLDFSRIGSHYRANLCHTATAYKVVSESLGSPDPFRVKYREALNEAAGMVVRDRQPMADALLALVSSYRQRAAISIQTEHGSKRTYRGGRIYLTTTVCSSGVPAKMRRKTFFAGCRTMRFSQGSSHARD